MLPTPFAHCRRKQRPHAFVEILPVIFPHGLIADHVRYFDDALLQPGATLRRIEAAGLRLPLPQHLRERTRSLDHLADRLTPARAEEIVRILTRSEEHTSELQSRQYLVCRLLL